MKTKLFFISIIVSVISLSTYGQDTIAAWTFPTGGAADANPDHHNAANATMSITTVGGTSTIDFSKNGLTTKAAQATGWDGGYNTKYWQIEVNTTNYNNLKLYSKQTAGGSYPGPRDWKAQYKVGSGSWTDIPGTNVVNANNWTSAVITNAAIPVACNNQASVLVRWIMTSDTSISPPALVISTGTTKIDDIYILGSVITSVDEVQAAAFSVYPNPCNGSFTLTSSESLGEISIYNMQGKVVYHNKPMGNLQQNIDLSDADKGVYLIRFRSGNDYKVEKILIQ